MPYEAKTDWKYDDTVTEKDLNRIEQGLKDAHVAERKSLTLSPGVQVVEVENDTPFNFGSVKGRTLNNLLGYAGACENANLWKTNSIIIEKYDEEKVQGDSCLKVALDSNFDSGNAFLFVENTTSGKSYVLIGYVKNGASYGVVRLEALEYNGENSIQFYVTPDVVNGDRLKPVHTAFTLSTTATRFAVHLAVSSTSPNSYGLFDAIRVYEIPTSEVARINSMSSEDVTKEFPYLDAMTNVRNPFAIVTGANFCPLFYDWRKSGGVAGEIEAPYVQRVPNHDGKRLNSNVSIPTIQGATYTYSIEREGGGDIGLDFLNAAGEVIQSSDYVNAGIITAKAPSGAVKTRVWTSVPERAGTYIFRNPMLTIGTEPKPFVPQQRSIWAAECNLAANPVDGSDPDVLYMGDDGLSYVIEKWGKPIIGINRTWRSSNSINGMRQILTPDFASVGSISDFALQYMTKYDGTQLKISGGVTVADTFILQPTTGWLYIGVSNTDSGWGEDYNPTEDEIKAYLLGWKMYDNINPSNPHTGSGKAWVKITCRGADGTWSTQTSDARTITPSEPAGTDSNGRVYTPYRLQYLKAKPTVEPVKNYETGATLCKGANMVEVGSGIVIREKANSAPGVSGEGNINNPYLPATMLRHKTYVISATVFKNNAFDMSWIPKGDNVLQSNAEYYDSSAVYHATYTMLDPTLAAPIIGSIATNLRGNVSDLVQHTGDMERRLSVVENKKAEKDNTVVWVKPSLINGWEYFGIGAAAGYTKIGNVVYLKGKLRNGTAGSVVFRLPSGYRPKEALLFLCRAYDTGNRSVTVGVDPNGDVSVYDTNKEVHLEGTIFIAEE